MSSHSTLGLSLLVMAVAVCGPTSSSDGTAAVADGGPRRGGVMGGGMGMMGRADTAAAPRVTPAATPAAAGCPAVDEALVTQGRAIFVGPGNCQTCHGANAKGTPLAPDLTDAQWLNIDGSYASISQLVKTGVPRPKQHPAPMPPMGGASLTPQQVCAVAAYVYSLSH